MSDRDALLAAIRENPEDDTPRLVLADWLDEHAPATKRRGTKARAAAPSAWAALIRTECEFARLEEEDSASAAVFRFFTEKDEQSLRGVRWDRVDPGVARLIELRTRANALRRAAKERPTGLSKVDTGAVPTEETRRGFPATFHITNSNLFALSLPALREQYPQVGVVFGNEVSNPDALVRFGLSGWCRELRFTDGHPGHAELIAGMSHTPATKSVRSLVFELYDSEATVRALDAVAGSPNWSGLRELTLTVLGSGTDMNDALGRLLRAPHLRELRRLHLRQAGNVLGVLPAICGLPELRELLLENGGLGDAGAEQLASAPALANLRHLDVQQNQIGGRGASALIASPHLKHLAVLDLDHNPVRNLDRAALAGAPAGGLRTIGFHGARLTVRDITALTTSPRLSELVYFDADNNELAESAVARLVQGFGDRPPAILYLASNNIREAGVAALTAWPAAAHIDMLHLVGNTLPTASAKALAACPHLQQLTHLCAGTAHPAGRKALKACFGDRAFV